MATRNKLSGRDRRERKNLEEMDDLGHHLLLCCIGCCQKDGMHTPPMMRRPESSEAAAATAYCAKDWASPSSYHHSPIPPFSLELSPLLAELDRLTAPVEKNCKDGCTWILPAPSRLRIGDDQDWETERDGNQDPSWSCCIIILQKYCITQNCAAA